jgi:hypothetical protein
MKADCTDEQFNLYLQETSVVADQIVETLDKSGLPELLVKIVWRVGHKYLEQMFNICVISSNCFIVGLYNPFCRVIDTRKE